MESRTYRITRSSLLVAVRRTKSETETPNSNSIHGHGRPTAVARSYRSISYHVDLLFVQYN